MPSLRATRTPRSTTRCGSSGNCSAETRPSGVETEGRAPNPTPDGHCPESIDRTYEDRLVELCASGNLDPERWAGTGPRFFMAGLAVMIAGERSRDRSGLLSLAEWLHPGASEVSVFNRWLESSPLRPTRFLPLLDTRLSHAA